MVFDHIADNQIFHRDMVIGLSIRFGDLEMMISSLSLNLQVGLGNIPGGLTPSMTAFLAAAHLTLLASERFLRAAIEARISYSVTITIREKGCEPNVNPNIRMRTRRGKMVRSGFGFTHNQGIPMSIRTMNHMHGFGSALDRTVQLDLEKLAQFSGNMHMCVISIQPHITGDSVLPELNGVPAIGRLETGKANIRNT